MRLLYVACINCQSLWLLWSCRAATAVALMLCALYAGAEIRARASHHVYRTCRMLCENNAMCSGHGAAGMMFFGDRDTMHDIAHPWALCGRAGGSGAGRLAKRGLNG